MDTTLIKNDILIITVRSASIYFDREDYNTEKFDEQDLCFDVFTIDKENKKLYTTRVGRGNDRRWSYDINNLKEKTNQTWILSEDEKTYMKILDDVTFPYTTKFTNINGYSIEHTFE